MPSSNAAWGIEVGAFAIKAIRLERRGDEAVVSDFAVIPHKKVLSTPDIDQNEIVRLGLGQFISQKSLEGETLVMSVPGHSAFARFAKLPPVEPKKVPDIVKFEAVQQIPFPIEEVEWDYQTFLSEDTPEVEVGIFAITRERVQQRLALYGELGIVPESLTLSPVAVFNAMAHDHELAARKMALIYLDIGTNASDLIVANGGNCWIRTFPLGGTHFTEAIAEAFKLSYSKAEKLKEEASTSKYAKQIMQAMRPVFSDLLQDVQRSLGYYQSVHRDVELKTIVGLGSTFKIPGLRKFLGQQLQMDVVRLDEYRRIRVEGREAAAFSENAVNMATAYGLALQGIGLAKIDINLVPVKVLRDQLWHGKIKWFAAAAAVAIVGGAINFIGPVTDQNALRGDGPTMVSDTIRRGESIKNDFQAVVEQHNRLGFLAENHRRLFDFRTVWPFVVNDAAAALASVNPQPELLMDNLEAITAIEPGDRRLVELQQLSGAYVPPGADGKRYIDVSMKVSLTHDSPEVVLNDQVAQWLRENAERPGVPYRILTDTVSCNLDRMVIGRTPTAEELASGERPRDTRQPNQPRDPQRPRDDRDAAPPGGDGMGMPVEPADPPAGGRDRGNDGGGFGRPGGPPRPGGGGGDSGGPRPGGGGGGGGGGDGQDAGDDQRGMPVGPPPSGGGGGNDSGYNAQQEKEILDLNAMAPVPQPPAILPPNTQYYETIITFTLELLDPTYDAAEQRAAQADGSSDEEAGS